MGGGNPQEPKDIIPSDSSLNAKLDSIKSVGVHSIKWVVIVLAVIFLMSGLWYKVEQTERGNVRRLGVAQYSRPVQPGFHFKMPFIDEVDRSL
jgi:hypothetical protein